MESSLDEGAFMNQLMLELDDSFSSSHLPSVSKTTGVLVPVPHTPVKAFKTPTRYKSVTSSPDVSASTLVPNNEDFNMAAFLEGCDTWDLDADLLTPVKPAPVVEPEIELPVVHVPLYSPETCTRCITNSVVEEYVDNRWRKAIVAHTEPGSDCVNVYLYDDWYHTDVRAGDRFNILGSFSSSRPDTISLTSQSNFLVLHPDLLLTATALANAPQCRRKPLLSALVRSTSDITPALVWGSMLHEVMQHCLQQGRWEEADIAAFVDEAVVQGLGQLVVLGIDEGTARKEVIERAKGLKGFKDRYLGQVPKADALLSNTRSRVNDVPSLLAITKLLDIEEDIWSPTYGLKGKLDATVQCIISEPAPSLPAASQSFLTMAPDQERIHTSIPLPLELKTGRPNIGMEHRAQTMLYTLLLSERYGADVSSGLLFYTASEGGDVVQVPRGRNEIRGLIGARNEMVAWMWRRIRKKGKGARKEDEDKMDVDIEDAISKAPLAQESQTSAEEEQFLPPPIDDERACKRCYALDTCLLFRKTHGSNPSLVAADRDPRIPAFLDDIYTMKTSHLTPARSAFFRRWERLLALEERDLVRFRRELWVLGAEEREKRGRCFGGMVLIGSGPQPTAGALPMEDEAQSTSKIHRFTYRFARSARWPFSLTSKTPSLGTNPNSTRNLLNGFMSVGDAITVSVEPHLLALARGYIMELTPTEVVLGVDHKLEVDDIRQRVASRSGGSPGIDSCRSSAPRNQGSEEVIFRIDKDELFGGMAKVRNNLAQLFYAGGDQRRLELVVDLRAPVFTSTSQSQPLPAHTSHLNPSQIHALQHILSAEDYALVLGMPGTGKTTVIAQLIRLLVGRGKTVLLASYTHSAVDTILMKVKGIGGDERGDKGEEFGILRLGNVDKVRPDVRKYTLNARRKATTVEQLERQLTSPPVVATTCLSIDSPLFSRRTFDYCIVDEASQITLPTCLGPLKFADKFVLVGDHFQLPPLVKNPEARLGGLDISLFRLLSQAHPHAITDLRHQYRMNEDIMRISNQLIYDNRLVCGSDEVKNRMLALKDRTFLGRLHVAPTQRVGEGRHLGKGKGKGKCKEGCWLEKVVAESCKAIFIDTDLLPARDSRVGDLVQNVTEAELVRQLTETLLRSGVNEDQIGIISLYRQQVKLLEHLLQERKGVEILTADRSQGRDKDCIIVSLVRSNEEGLIGDLVKDWRRMNVSFTRARSKLVIFGSRKTLQRESLLAQFFDLMDTQGWIYQLQEGAESTHDAIFGVSTSDSESGSRKRSLEVVDLELDSDSDVEIVSGPAPVPTPDSTHSKPLAHARTNATASTSIGAPEKAKKPVKKTGKENAFTLDSWLRGGSSKGTEGQRPAKKTKVAGARKDGGAGVLRGRPILLDLVANET